jgi:DNA-binding CsgD family transcriptional regulator
MTRPIPEKLAERIEAHHRRASHLAERKAQVLALAANGYTNPEIADRLGITVETVKTHLLVTRQYLGARNTTHAVALALCRGLLDPDYIQD